MKRRGPGARERAYNSIVEEFYSTGLLLQPVSNLADRPVVSDNAVVDNIFNRGITGSWSCQAWELVQKSLEGNAIGQGGRDIVKKWM